MQQRPFAIAVDGRLTCRSGVDAAVPWWSFGKTVIAAAALALVREDKLALDDQLPGRRFTLRQLLQHRAGVTNYGSLPAYHRAVEDDEEPWSVDELMRRLDVSRPVFPPGGGWEYSNMGYLLVRQLIEQACDADLDAALRRLVFGPLAIEGARVASARSDLAGVVMGDIPSYHPGWVYHGLVVGPLTDAALVLARIMRGDLLPKPLLDQMCDALPLSGPVAGRPWQTAGYGLGVMIGTGRNGRHVIGHTGGGPGSVIAVYHHMDEQPRRTMAAFAPGGRDSEVEAATFGAS